MIVLGIIAVLAGSAIYMLVGSVDTAKDQRVDSDVQAIKQQLSLYEMQNYTFPTTAQGLELSSRVRPPNLFRASGASC